MQYVGQSYVLPIALPHGAIEAGRPGGGRPTSTPPTSGRMASRDRRADRDREPAPRGDRADPAVDAAPDAAGRRPPAEPRPIREVYFAETGGFTPTPIYDRATFSPVTG